MARAGHCRLRACCRRTVPEFLSSIHAPTDPRRARQQRDSSSNLWKIVGSHTSNMAPSICAMSQSRILSE
jgi:hypothetical protein